MRRTVGIIGGMGPEATADIFRKIIRATPACGDRDHLRILVDNNPAIPDRLAAIHGHGPDPTPVLTEMAVNLEKAGAELLAMPCNTAHYFYPAIRAAVGVPVLHIMEETATLLFNDLRGRRKVGLLATDGTIETGLYHRALERRRLEVVVPDEEHQALVMNCIYEPTGVKAGQYRRPRVWLRRVMAHLAARGAEVLVLGCTELPLLFNDGYPGPIKTFTLPQGGSIPVVDATEVLASAVVREALRDDRRAQV
ncbi:MAG TPA: amino acid racemase [Sphingobacteriaceae bacterium]|nr:amino acid racemase [Sphingobacteriaceae bacterium]